MLKLAFSPQLRWLLLALALIDSEAARADDAFFMIVFGQQDGVDQLDLSHTFATFIKAAGNGPDKTKYTVDSHTISWMPRSLHVKLLRRPEEGVNLDLKDTLRHAKAIKCEVSMWGAFHIKKELYERALQQEARLKKGDIDYKALDARFRPKSAMNCIHAVCDIDTDKGLLGTGTAHGNDASFMVLRHLSRWIIDYDETYDWIGQRLDLGKDIFRRDFQPKVSDESKKGTRHQSDQGVGTSYAYTAECPTPSPPEARPIDPEKSASTRPDNNQDELKAMVEKAITAVGGKDKLARIHAFSASVKMTFKEEKSIARYTADVSVQGFDRIRIAMALGDNDKVETTVINGDKGSIKWGTEQLVMPEKMVNEHKNRLYGLRLAYTLTPLLEKDVSLASLAEIRVNDRPAVGMIVTKKDHPDINLYFDKATNLPAQLEFEINAPGGKKTVVCIFGDYKEFGGIRCFTKVTSQTENDLTVEAEFANVRLLEKLDAKLFALPQ